MEAFLGVLSGGAAGGLVVWLLRSWITERLQQSIRHEYSQKLENHRTELNIRIQEIRHEGQLLQLRTSLFFDHQRDAFAKLLAEVARVNDEWVKRESIEGRVLGPVPTESYTTLRSEYHAHQLFLDGPSLVAMDLVLDYYRSTFPVYSDPDGPPIYRDADAAYEAIRFLEPRLAEVFRGRIGVSNGAAAERDIVFLGAVRLLSTYGFSEVGLPPKGPLRITQRDPVAEIVARAEENRTDLVEYLSSLQDYLRRDGGHFHEAALKAGRYLKLITSVGQRRSELTE